MQPIYKMEWRPMKQHKNPQLRTTVEEEYKREMDRIDRKRQQMRDIETNLKKKEFNPNLDKDKKWEEMNKEFDKQRKVLFMIWGFGFLVLNLWNLSFILVGMYFIYLILYIYHLCYFPKSSDKTQRNYSLSMYLIKGNESQTRRT
jgi:hypothetical protein